MVHCLTCAMRIPVTMASWCSVPSAPLRLVGAISPTYIGVNPDANPEEREHQRTDRKLYIWQEDHALTHLGHLFYIGISVLTTVGSNDKSSQDHHFKGAAELAHAHQTATDEGQQVIYEHGFPPAKTHRRSHSNYTL